MLFLVLLLGINGLSYHPLAHAADEDQLNCELCEAVVIQEDTPLIIAPEAEILSLPVLVETPVLQLPKTSTIASIDGAYPCRPPPSA